MALFFSLPLLCFALDESGCLFCHQYPGLVRLEHPYEPSEKLKILHIDEEGFSASTHGELSCKKCHATIKSVPHTGESKVDCTASCHKDDEVNEMIKDYPLSGFHKNEQSYIVSLNDKSSCAVCHRLYPHSKNRVARAFLNMHTGFMQCEVCHIKKSKFKNIIFEWRETQDVQFSGKPFGTYYDPQTKKTQKNQNYISRITVHILKNGKKINLTNRVDVKKARIFMSRKKRMTPDDADQALFFFHRDIEQKEASVACNQCHSINGVLNFNSLGFDEKKTKNLERINIKGLITKYKTFYFPSLFGF